MCATCDKATNNAAYATAMTTNHPQRSTKPQPAHGTPIPASVAAARPRLWLITNR